MGNILTREFIASTGGLEGVRYIESFIDFSIAPVIENFKPSWLINFVKNNRNLLSNWEKYKEEFMQLNSLDIFVLKQNSHSELVLFYNRAALEVIVHNSETAQFLERYGYNKKKSVNSNLLILKDNFQKSCPHEIGIFLGFPKEDVEGFIKNKGKNYILNGYWKVYSNPENAVKIFNSYDWARYKVLKSIKMRQV